jgi:putative transcriptional regulator
MMTIMAFRWRTLSAASLLLALLGPACCWALAPSAGQLLQARADLPDPRFRDRVILLVQHSAEGSAGLILNRPSRLPLAALLADGSPLAGDGRVLSYGGPVEPQTLLALVQVRNQPPEPADEIIDQLYLTGLETLEVWPEFEREVVDFRIFSGYAGWAAGQLEAEMQRGDWSELPSGAGVVFDPSRLK